MSNFILSTQKIGNITGNNPTKDLAKTAVAPTRLTFTKQRRSLSRQQRQLAAKQASTQLYKLNAQLANHAKVGLYYDDFGELPTQPILDWCHYSNYHAYLPIVGTLGRMNKQLRFAKISVTKLSQLPTVIHPLKIQQPYSRQYLYAEDLDIVFCPLVAADLQGNRMGMGGGYYDTTLARIHRQGLKKPIIIGWAYDFQVVECLQRQLWDVPLDMLMTPSRLLRF